MFIRELEEREAERENRAKSKSSKKSSRKAKDDRVTIPNEDEESKEETEDVPADSNRRKHR